MKKYIGEFGGQFVPETLMETLMELETEFGKALADGAFLAELHYYLENYAGRPTPLYFAKNLSKKMGAKIYLKREDLLHTGAHKINNALGQCLLAKRMGKGRVIAETGAGQHGVATATAAALLNLECEIYMGAEDAERQRLNVYRMKLLGAKVNIVEAGSKTLKNAINAALRDYTANCIGTHYVIGSVVGPHPFPTIVREFQKVIGEETKEQIMKVEKTLPNYVVACVGGGSNALGIFYPFVQNLEVKLIGVEAAGKGLDTKEHCATLEKGSQGILHGMKSYLLQDENGQVQLTHSISAGLDYPGVGPYHSYLKDTGRAEYVSATDEEALEAFHLLSQLEGIVPALEPAHAIAHLLKMRLKPSDVAVICLSGRGDKDVQQVARMEGFL